MTSIQELMKMKSAEKSKAKSVNFVVEKEELPEATIGALARLRVKNE